MADEIQGLSESVREHIKENAEDAFDKLSDEQAQHMR